MGRDTLRGMGRRFLEWCCLLCFLRGVYLMNCYSAMEFSTLNNHWVEMEIFASSPNWLQTYVFPVAVAAVSFSIAAWATRKKPHRMKLFPLIMFHADHIHFIFSMPKVFMHNICYCLLYFDFEPSGRNTAGKNCEANIKSHCASRHRCYRHR